MLGLRLLLKNLSHLLIYAYTQFTQPSLFTPLQIAIMEYTFEVDT